MISVPLLASFIAAVLFTSAIAFVTSPASQLLKVQLVSITAW